jgi:hypothetical protein
MNVKIAIKSPIQTRLHRKLSHNGFGGCMSSR